MLNTDPKFFLGYTLDSFKASLKKSDCTCGGDHTYMCGNLTYMWGDNTIPVPYKVRGTIRSYMWGAIHTCGGTIQYLFYIR